MSVIVEVCGIAVNCDGALVPLRAIVYGVGAPEAVARALAHVRIDQVDTRIPPDNRITWKGTLVLRIGSGTMAAAMPPRPTQSPGQQWCGEPGCVAAAAGDIVGGGSGNTPADVKGGAR